MAEKKKSSLTFKDIVEIYGYATSPDEQKLYDKIDEWYQIIHQMRGNRTLAEFLRYPCEPLSMQRQRDIVECENKIMDIRMQLQEIRHKAEMEKLKERYRIIPTKKTKPS